MADPRFYPIGVYRVMEGGSHQREKTLICWLLVLIGKHAQVELPLKQKYHFHGGPAIHGGDAIMGSRLLPDIRSIHGVFAWRGSKSTELRCAVGGNVMIGIGTVGGNGKCVAWRDNLG
ncbi:hypothetical protein Tco_0532597 [Tanacetum coccineum]